MKTVAIIQARMTSTRLPGKVLMDLAGRPMLARQIERLRACTAIDELMIATTVNATDDPIVALAETEQLGCFRGSESDVLGRFVGAAKQSEAEVIVRLTADCPLIDAGLVDAVVTALTDPPAADYASNVIERTYPRGLDAEAFTLETLTRLDQSAVTDESREHVTSFLRQDRPDLFEVRSVVDDEDNSDLRWTVDTESDLQLVRLLYERLNLADNRLPYRDILKYVRQHAELSDINTEAKTWDPVAKRPDPESEQ